MDQKQATPEKEVITRFPVLYVAFELGEQHLENGVQRWPEGPAGRRYGEGSGASSGVPF